MEFSFTYPTVGTTHDPALITPTGMKAVLEAAEASGFGAVGFTDHPIPSQRWMDAGGHDAFDPFTALAFCAAVTERIRLMSNVAVIPYRNPFLLAKMVATVDVLSDGRTILGAGAGYLKAEYRALGVGFDERNELFDEALDTIIAVWSEDEVVVEGRHFTAPGNSANPKPVQDPHPPIWIGGESAPALKRAAAFGDCWYPIGSNPRFPLDTPVLLAKRVKRLHELSEDVGRDPSTIGLACGINWMNLNHEVKKSDGSRKTFTGSKEQIADDIGCLKELGIHYLSLNFPGTTTESIIDGMANFMNNVAPLAE